MPMPTPAAAADIDDIVYPESDGQPMADNSVQYGWMGLLKWNIEALVPDFVAGDHLIYPVRGDVVTRIAPDVFVAFGRGKGDRRSYRVWDEGGVFPQVVFEVVSPSNTADEMARKRAFYDRFGADEFYVVTPEFPMFLEIWVRPPGGRLDRVPNPDGFASPRLGVTFTLKTGELRVFGPNGREWEMPDEALRQRDRAEGERDRVEAERDQVEAERDRVGAERDREKVRREEAERKQVAAAARAEKLAAKLRAFGLDPDAD